MNNYFKLPSLENGIILEPHHKSWSVIVPEETENLLSNPSFEYKNTGWDGIGGTTYILANDSAFGAFSYQRARGTGWEIWRYYDFEDEQQYTLSVYVKAAIGVQFTVYCGNLSKQFTVQNDFWNRYVFSFKAVKVASSKLRFVVSSSPSGYNSTTVYVDAFQLEKKLYPTTYCDGDMVGFGISDVEYYWSGYQGVSTSFRSAKCAAGGRIISLFDNLDFFVSSVIGFNVPEYQYKEVKNATSIIYYSAITSSPRDMTIVGTLYGKTKVDLHRSISTIIDLLKPNRVYPEQPVVIVYTPTDETGAQVSENLHIPCYYKEGLSGNLSNPLGEEFSIRFTGTQYGIQSELQSTLGELSWGHFEDLATGETPIFWRNVDEEWQLIALNTGVNYASAIIGNEIWVGGLISLVEDRSTFSGAPVNVDNIAVFNKNSGWSAPQGLDAQVLTIGAFAFPSSGYESPIIGGAFTTTVTGTIENMRRIAYLDTDNEWHEIRNGFASGSVDILATDGSFRIAAHGSSGALEDNIFITEYDGSSFSAWTDIAPAGNVVLTGMAFGNDNRLYVCGEVGTTMGTCAAYYDFVSETWTKMGNVPASTFSRITVDKKTGIIYISTSLGLMMWTTNNWKLLGPAYGELYQVAINNGDGYGIGRYVRTEIYGYGYTGVSVDNNGVHLSDISSVGRLVADGSAAQGDIAAKVFVSRNGEFSLTGWEQTDATTIYTWYWPNVTEIDCDTIAYPVIELVGPGSIHRIENLTNKKVLYFRNFTLNESERIHLLFSPLGLLVKRNGLYVNDANILEPFSDSANFFLSEGVNRISISNLSGVYDSDITRVYIYGNRSFSGISAVY